MNKKTNIYDLSICMYVFCAVVTDDGSLLMKLARLFLIGVWGLKILVEKRIKVSPYILRMTAFGLFATFSVAWAESTQWAIGMSKTLLINLVCMCALMNLMDYKKERIDLVMKTMTVAPLLLELRVIMMGGFLAFLDARSVGSISGNIVGLCAAVGACIAVYYWLHGCNSYGVLFAMNTAIVILSASRKALLFICIPLIVLYIFDTKAVRKRRFFRCMLILLSGIVGLWLTMRIQPLYELIGRRIEGLFATLAGNTVKVDSSSESRALLITRGLRWFRERPLLGYGIDCYRVVLVKHYPAWPIDTYAHNNFVELLVDTGIIGTTLYYWNYMDVLRKSWRNRKTTGNEELLLFGMFIALIICEVALVSYFDKYVQILVLIIWIFMSKLDQTRKNVEIFGS